MQKGRLYLLYTSAFRKLRLRQLCVGVVFGAEVNYYVRLLLKELVKRLLMTTCPAVYLHNLLICHAKELELRHELFGLENQLERVQCSRHAQHWGVYTSIANHAIQLEINYSNLPQNNIFNQLYTQRFVQSQTLNFIFSILLPLNTNSFTSLAIFPNVCKSLSRSCWDGAADVMTQKIPIMPATLHILVNVTKRYEPKLNLVHLRWIFLYAKLIEANALPFNEL